MHNLESVLENETHKIVRDFEIQIGWLILAGWPDLLIVNKKKENLPIVDFAIFADHRVNSKESKKRNNNLTLLEN